MVSKWLSNAEKKFRLQFINVLIPKIEIKSISVYHHISVNQAEIDEVKLISSVNTEHRTKFGHCSCIRIYFKTQASLTNEKWDKICILQNAFMRIVSWILELRINHAFVDDLNEII